MVTLDEIITKGIYFIFNDCRFRHASICLAEGLQELSIPIFSNQTNWLTESREFLFKEEPSIDPCDCAVVILDISDLDYTRTFRVFEKDWKERVVTVMVNNADDEAWHEEFDNSHYILRTHMSNLIPYPNNFVPWAFGISNRIIKSTESPKNFKERKQEVLVNFRESNNQSVRVLMEYILIPYLSKIFTTNRTIERGEPTDIDVNSLDYLYWNQTGNRHNPAYYNRLKNTALCCAYGGSFAYTKILADMFKKEAKHQGFIGRWDSWRFWESLAAGCVTIHLDFEKYGFMLPVMPENWEHYVGIDLDNLKEIIERINDEPEILNRISIKGRKWALENYSPIATACRFLDIVTEEEMGTTKAFVDILNKIP